MRLSSRRCPSFCFARFERFPSLTSPFSLPIKFAGDPQDQIGPMRDRIGPKIGLTHSKRRPSLDVVDRSPPISLSLAALPFLSLSLSFPLNPALSFLRNSSPSTPSSAMSSSRTRSWAPSPISPRPTPAGCSTSTFRAASSTAGSPSPTPSPRSCRPAPRRRRRCRRPSPLFPRTPGSRQTPWAGASSGSRPSFWSPTTSWTGASRDAGSRAGESSFPSFLYPPLLFFLPLGLSPFFALSYTLSLSRSHSFRSLFPMQKNIKTLSGTRSLRSGWSRATTT
jgi:hypothetical protein